MKHKRFKIKILLLCIPGFAGFLSFYLFSFMKGLWYSFINDAYNKNFVWFDNYLTVFQNKYFRLALKNTLLFSLLGVASLLILSFFIALGLSKIKKNNNFIKSAFLLPMFLPSVSVIFAWRIFFDNDIYFAMMKAGNNFIQILPICALYLWKNAGINVILLTAAFTQLPSDVMDAAQLDGAKGYKLYRYVTLPLVAPHLFFVGILSFVNSLKIFKESYLFYNTNYPPDPAYNIQFYMNNHFYKLNYPYLSCASAVVAILLAVLIFVVYQLQNKSMRDVSL